MTISCNTFATSITTYLENGSMVDKSQVIAAHDRRLDAISLDEIERIII